ncbi:SusC/RagA family TonB-linked outer membrane protein [Pedobacter gandavensis]|uniref:SusC/RagA family TonB-linked outer membrane protein n=1 Tax=Pedobacter gandavensis TaxID=2679963 RepID=A0ABR6F349_9SPHI|nr:SusC/RagA family TonB-linked outer membrane protein [Pedobacter gandavensis]MBB2151666.1 SusC/RagA family TonB-linked outer membrane protein [Pedobacter gandavensis]
MKQMYLKCMAVLLLSVITITAYAQQKVTGTVTEKSGQPIPGVSVTEKGSKNGTSTNADGKFSISVKKGATLVFSSVGLGTKEVNVGNNASLGNVVLEDDANALNEVVVTALGIKREKKSLGYAMQELKGETLVDAREPNLVNALSGKVAGLQITRSSSGPTGSSKITLRGNNSLTGENQPLIVVDGVPMDNFTGAKNNDFSNPSLDMGSGLADINPEDIESMSVLKGPTASALYGSRAGNGVILITTKSGKAQAGLGITVTSSLGIESVFTGPNLQNSFGQGENSIYKNISNASWGPHIEGQLVTKWNGEQVPLQSFDNIGNYFQNGISLNNGISFQQQYKGTSIYTSLNRADDKSVIPGVKLTRTNLTARAVSKFGKDDRWTTDTKVQYINSNAENRPLLGSRSENAFAAIYNLPRSMDIRDFSAAKKADGNMLWYGGGNQINPYWARQYNLNQDIRDRFLMNGSLKYQFNNWLTAEVKGGADMYTTNTETKVYGGSPIVSTGRYGAGKNVFTETNFSTLITAKQDNLFSKVGGAMTLGGNLMSSKASGLAANSGELVVPDFFSLNNGVNRATIEEDFRTKKINSVYGSGQLNWDQYLFLDVTFRNDWTTTLNSNNRSYFYPSVSTSFVFSDMITKTGGTLPSWMSYGKVRASYAEVGNDLDAYKLYNTYTISKDPNGNTTASRNKVLNDPNVKSELIKAFEVGAEMRFFDSKFGFDIAYYKSNATRQLLEISMDPLSGYEKRRVNAGDIQNTGFEAMLDARMMSNQNGLNWNMLLNFSRNNNTVKEITPDVREYQLGGYDDVYVLAVTNQKYGEIYGSKYLRVEDASSPFNGQLILDADGLPQRGAQKTRLGNQQANALLGLTNSFAYKGFGLSFLVDARFGGQIFSGTNAAMQENGTAAITAPNGLREQMVVGGVILNGGQYVQNSIPVTPERYWAKVHSYGNLGIGEENIYSATNIRLRNVQLNYTIPTKFLSKTPIQRAKIGVSCNNVWLISGDMNGIDPESVYATKGNATGFENFSAPTTRTFLFNLTLGF